jgi:hypothetical protein
MKKKTLAVLIAIVAIVVVLMFAGCVEEEKSEVNPYQDQIDMIETKSGIEFSNWDVEEFKDGYVVTADSYDDSQPTGMKTGRPIWYIEGTNVYWVNGKAKTVSWISEEAPKAIQDAILYPELVKEREELLEEFDIVELNEDLLFDYDEDKGSRLICEMGGFALYKAPKGGSGTTYHFNPCDKQINIKLLEEATHKDWKYRYYFVEIDGHQGWISSKDIEQYNSLRPFEQELENNPELKSKIEAEELANKNSPYLELDNPNWNIIDKNEIYYWTYNDEESTILCYSEGFGLYEKLPDDLFGDRGRKFAKTNPCGKTLKLKVLKEASHKEGSCGDYWLVDYEGSVGWVNKGWLEENNK